MTPEARAVLRILTDRERLALDSLLLFSDYSDEEHAERLNIKPATFRSVVYIAKSKLRCKTRVALVMEWQRISKQLLQQNSEKTH